MQTVQVDGNEAMASVGLPERQPQHIDQNDTQAWKTCDAVMVEIYVHVVGLLINISETMSSEDVAVMVGLDRAVISVVHDGCQVALGGTCQF